MACGLSCPEACGILVSWPGIERQSPLHWKADSQPRDHQGALEAWLLQRSPCMRWVTLMAALKTLCVFPFNSWVNTYTGLHLFRFIPLGDCWASWVCRLMSLKNQIWDILVIPSSYLLSSPSLAPLLGLLFQVFWSLSCALQVSLALSIFKIFSFCFLFWII